MDDVGREFELAKKHQDHIKKRNEWCFLKDNQHVKYHSFILLEIIPLEKINQLFDGLDNLYSEVLESGSCSSRLDYRRTLSNCQSKLFQRYTLYLPPLATSRLKGKIFPCVAFHDLGNNFQEMEISISHPIPSTIILQINVHLEEEISKKINDIIYEYHTEKREPIKGTFTRIFSPDHQKESEIYQLRKSLHEEVVNFLRKYFSGYFFELVNTTPSVVPSIDVFSLDLPSKDDEIVNWGKENHGFLRCFSTFIDPYYCFRHDNYLLTFETNDANEYNNYLIFSNRLERDTGYYDIDSGIKGEINDCDFDLLAIDRFIKQQENHVGELNLIISQEIENIQSNNFNKAIGNRKKVIQTSFSFERFSVEFKRFRFFPIEFEFNKLVIGEQSSKQIEFFKGLQDNINARIKEITALNSLFSHEHETILSLKNLEFNRRMQWLVLILAIIMLIFTVIQIQSVLASFWVSITKNIASGIGQVVGT